MVSGRLPGLILIVALRKLVGEVKLISLDRLGLDRYNILIRLIGLDVQVGIESMVFTTASSVLRARS